MTNANPLIQLRNKAITWIAIAVVALWSTWWVYGFFVGNGAPITKKIEDYKTSLVLIKKEGVISQKNWDEMTSEEKKNERWSTMTRLVPILQKLAGVGTASAGKNIVTMKNISHKVGNEDYIPWLEKSWTGDAETMLTKTQTDVAEIIPVFAGMSDVASTQNITGKITLKTLNDYIQGNIVDQYGLVNAFGQIGIDRVRFLEEAPEVGVYDVPLKFERVPNENVLNLLKFLGKTGGVRITENGKSITIEHENPQPIKTDSTQSSLKNLLITIKDMSITPARNENEDARFWNISTKGRNMWDVTLTLEFYIRGVSRDYIANLDNRLTTLLDKNGRDSSLIAQGNTLLKQCNGCTYAPEIRDIITLLGQARTAYDSIIIEEKDPKAAFSPTEILEHRTKLITTVETLEQKLKTIASRISPTN